MRRVSLADVAKAAGVAKATASRALSARDQDVGAATRARILEVAADLGYQPNRAAQSLRTGRSRVLAVAVPSGRTGWEGVLAGAVAQASRRGYQLVLHSPGKNEGAEDAFARLPADGLLAIAPGRAWEAPVPADGAVLPAVVVDDTVEHSSGTVVRTALWHAGRAAGVHLAAQGRTRLAVLAEAAGPLIDGFAAACAEAGLRQPEVVVAPSVLAVDADGFFAVTPALAARAVTGFRRAGLTVPGDVSAVAFGDGELARHADPPLTVVRPLWGALGARAVDVLVDAVEDVAVAPATVELAAELVVRESSVPERSASQPPGRPGHPRIDQS